MTQTIVVGVDGSDDSFAALASAADLAAHTGSALSVVFVHEIATGAFVATYDGIAEHYLEQTVNELEHTSRERTFDVLARRPLKWTFDVALGDPAHELIRAAITRSASLIIVGGRGHSLLGGLVLGSVAQKLVRSSPVSVLVCRHPDVNNGDRQVREKDSMTPTA